MNWHILLSHLRKKLNIKGSLLQPPVIVSVFMKNNTDKADGLKGVLWTNVRGIPISGMYALSYCLEMVRILKRELSYC